MSNTFVVPRTMCVRRFFSSSQRASNARTASNMGRNRLTFVTRTVEDISVRTHQRFKKFRKNNRGISLCWRSIFLCENQMWRMPSPPGRRTYVRQIKSTARAERSMFSSCVHLHAQRARVYVVVILAKLSICLSVSFTRSTLCLRAGSLYPLLMFSTHLICF